MTIKDLANSEWWWQSVTDPKTRMPDILGNERPAGEAYIGSCQLRMPGMMFIFR